MRLGKQEGKRGRIGFSGRAGVLWFMVLSQAPEFLVWMMRTICLLPAEFTMSSHILVICHSGLCKWPASPRQ